jgi:hypothetical protein
VIKWKRPSIGAAHYAHRYWNRARGAGSLSLIAANGVLPARNFRVKEVTEYKIELSIISGGYACDGNHTALKRG